MVVNKVLFTENMETCARIEPNQLASLMDALKTSAEFGIDFETCAHARQSVQQLLGLTQPPSLGDMTRLCADWLVIGYCNLLAADVEYLPQLQQWLDFLVDFYFQDAGNLSHQSVAESVDSVQIQAPDQVGDAVAAVALSNSSSTDSCSTDTSQESDETADLNEHMMTAALETYRRHKKQQQQQRHKLAARGNLASRCVAQDAVQAVDRVNISKSLLVSALQLMACVDQQRSAAACVRLAGAVDGVLSRVKLHSTDAEMVRLCDNLLGKFR